MREEVHEEKLGALLGRLAFDDEVLDWVRDALHEGDEGGALRLEDVLEIAQLVLLEWRLILREQPVRRSVAHSEERRVEPAPVVDGDAAIASSRVLPLAMQPSSTGTLASQ